VVWVAVGGRGTLIGPVVGAIAVNALKSWATRAYPDLWLIILGAMFVIVVLFLPKGIVGLPSQLLFLFRRSSASLKKRSARPDIAPELPLKTSGTRYEKEIHPHS
jgi:membrane-bound ClpP family serine protease